jgi:hypothetical protein
VETAVSKASTHQLSKENIRKYGGQSVAVMDDKIVATCPNLYEEIKKIKKKHPTKEIAVRYIPTEDLLIL